MKQFVIRIQRSNLWEWVAGPENIKYEDWDTLKDAEARAKALQAQGCKVIIYQEV